MHEKSINGLIGNKLHWSEVLTVHQHILGQLKTATPQKKSSENILVNVCSSFLRFTINVNM